MLLKALAFNCTKAGVTSAVHMMAGNAARRSACSSPALIPVERHGL